MCSEHFCECVRPLLEKAGGWWSTAQEQQEIRSLNSVICILGAQRYKSLGELGEGKTLLSTNIFEIARCSLLGSEHGTDTDLEEVWV